MVDARCECGVGYSVAEADVGKQSLLCRKCGKELRFVSAEPLPEGAGAGDFDTRLIITAGPGGSRVGEQIILGGCCEIELGKLPERHISLAGDKVSRLHCKLLRLDFGPSRWNLEDNHSTNGLYVNGKRVTTHELKEGDVVQVGEYTLRYATDAARALAKPPPLPPMGVLVGTIPSGPVPACPCCEKMLFPGARVCTDCGIYVPSGRPLVTAKGMDDERVEEVAKASIYLVSFATLVGMLPVASEAMGTRKPYAMWTIAALTVLCSFAFFPVTCDRVENPSPFALNLMLWTGDRAMVQKEIDAELAKLDEAEKKLEDDWKEIEKQSDRQRMVVRDRARARQVEMVYERHRRNYEQTKEEIEARRQAAAAQLPDKAVGFQPHQLFTNAFLHEGILHLAGNLLFLLVFGLRVNELLGNLKTAIVYPVLAALSSAAMLWAHRDLPLAPALGASGAIAGLAGMYLVFFPVQRIRMIAYMNLWPFTAFQCLSVLFWIRGFWLLPLLFIWDDVVPVIVKEQDHVGHWAHLGGFGSGILLAVALLLARQAKARGDVLSVVLGKYAWPLVGRPTRLSEIAPAAAAPTPALPVVTGAS